MQACFCCMYPVLGGLAAVTQEKESPSGGGMHLCINQCMNRPVRSSSTKKSNPRRIRTVGSRSVHQFIIIAGPWLVG